MSAVYVEYRQEKKIKIIYLNQDGGNRFTSELLTHLDKALEDEKQLIGIILTSQQKQFSVGGDIFKMGDFLEDNNPEGYIDLIVPLANKIIIKIMSHRLPIIAAINGSAAGGGLSLALACDYRIAIPGIKLSMAFGKLALSPDSGSSIVFPLRFGREEALFGIVTGKIYSSEEARHYGAINQISDECLEDAMKVIATLSSGSLWTFTRTKELMINRYCSDISNQLHQEYLQIRESTSRSEFHEKLNMMIKNLAKKSD